MNFFHSYLIMASKLLRQSAVDRVLLFFFILAFGALQPQIWFLKELSGMEFGHLFLCFCVQNYFNHSTPQTYFQILA